VSTAIDLVELEVADLLKQNGYENVEFVRVSGIEALAGDAVAKQGILDLTEAVDRNIPIPVREKDRPFLMPIEDVFSISGRGTVVTGRIERGCVKYNDTVHIVGFGDKIHSVVVTGVEMFHKTLEDGGMPGDNVGLLIRTDLNKDEILRGMVFAAPGSCKPHKKFRANLYVLKAEEGGRHKHFGVGYRPQLFVRTCNVTCEIKELEKVDVVMPGDHVELVIQTIEPVALEKGQRFAIREGGKTIGAGTIIEILE